MINYGFQVLFLFYKALPVIPPRKTSTVLKETIKSKNMNLIIDPLLKTARAPHCLPQRESPAAWCVSAHWAALLCLPPKRLLEEASLNARSKPHGLLQQALLALSTIRPQHKPSSSALYILLSNTLSGSDACPSPHQEVRHIL